MTATIIKICGVASKLKYMIYRLYELLHIISSTAVCLDLPMTWTIHIVFAFSLIE
jgi:hypothetical protein